MSITRIIPAFDTGNAYRFFHPFSMANGEVRVIEAVALEPILLTSLQLELVSGHIVLETVLFGTPGGTFGTTIDVANLNRLDNAPLPASPMTLAYGGTHTGGVVLDQLTAKTADQAHKASSVGGSPQDARGIGTNTYYLRMTSTGASVGLLRGALCRPHITYPAP